MATTTNNLNLIKPDSSEYFDIEVMNQNMDNLDAAFKNLLDTISTKLEDLKSSMSAPEPRYVVSDDIIYRSNSSKLKPYPTTRPAPTTINQSTLHHCVALNWTAGHSGTVKIVRERSLDKPMSPQATYAVLRGISTAQEMTLGYSYYGTNKDASNDIDKIIKGIMWMNATYPGANTGMINGFSDSYVYVEKGMPISVILSLFINSNDNPDDWGYYFDDFTVRGKLVS